MNKWSFSKNIAIAGILCLSIGFLSFAGPGEDYKKSWTQKILSKKLCKI